MSNYALKMVTSSRADKLVLPLDFLIDVGNTTIGTSKTATVEIVSSSTLNNDDISLLLEYIGPISAATWNSADKASNINLFNNNMAATPTTSAIGAVRATSGASAGKLYFEITFTGTTVVSSDIGFNTATTSLAGHLDAYVTVTTGAVWIGGSYQGFGLTGGAALISGDVIGIAVDFTAQRVWFRCNNGLWNASGAANPATNTGGRDISAIFTGIAAYPAVMFNGLGPIQTLNLGATSFAFTIPGGFSAWAPAVTSSPIANFVSSLSSVLTTPSALPSSSQTWTMGGYTFWSQSDVTFSSTAPTFSSSLLTVTTGTGTSTVRGLTSYTSGKYYFEFTMTSWAGSSSNRVGVVSATGNLGVSQSTQVASVSQGGVITVNGSTQAGNLGTRANDDIIGVALDITNQRIWFRVAPSGNWNADGAANPATNTGGYDISVLTSGLYPMLGALSSVQTTLNAGATAFSGGVPSGFTSGLPLSLSSKQKLSVTFTPQVAGRVRGIVKLGKPSTTVWVNPQITIT